jgi:hypothetical protein
MINRNEAQMVQKIEELLGDMALNFRHICELLAGLDRHYLHRDPMFRWYREVAGGKLASELVMAMCRAQPLIKHMIGRPREVQMTLAHDGQFDWVREVKGKIEVKRGSWRQMSQAEFKRMFPINGPVQSVQEQRNVLQAIIEAWSNDTVHGMSQPEAPAYVRGHAMPKLDLVHNKFMLGREAIPLTVLVSVMQANGMTVQLSQTAAELWLEGYDRAELSPVQQDAAVH